MGIIESFLQHSETGAHERAPLSCKKRSGRHVALRPSRTSTTPACNKTTAMTDAGSLILHGALNY